MNSGGGSGDKANGEKPAEPKRINVLATGSVDQSVKVRAISCSCVLRCSRSLPVMLVRC